ncbi:MAG: single-stranded-DNA-specific exonuclease RecJ [Bacteroidales bacterium]|nr:single-stranded-DNA-specific exonuclease RecJ [Bacteroidales bacterium]
MYKRFWNVKKYGDESVISRLQKEINVDRIVANLLSQRGISTYDEAKKFFRPSLDDLYDPYLMKDMEKAVERLSKAIDAGEKILIFGDYDVDGTTATALMIRFLRKQKANVDYYIPDRYTEGYGISKKGIDYARETKVSLLISVDCGIKANSLIDYAVQGGIDVIVCDHHSVGDEIPNAYAVLDPKRPDCDYPFKELSGCGVAFKFLQAYTIKRNIPLEEVSCYLDLLVVSISSDIVPIVDENRILAFWGLKLLNTSPCLGLECIIDLITPSDKVKTDLQVNDIVFKIGPRINAAGRMNTGRDAVELLIIEDEKDLEKASDICRSIDELNSVRKSLDEEITKEAICMIEENNLQDRYSTVLYSPQWHRGIVGIVASKLIEEYYRPTVIFTDKGDGVLVGSARSVVGFDLYKAVTACGDLLEAYGGHTFAAGLSLKKENFEAFCEKFESFVKENITEQQRRAEINIDMEIDISEITPKLMRILKQFAPFGPGNMTPIFMSSNVHDTGAGRRIGKDLSHLKLCVSSQIGANECIDGVGFGFGDCYELITDSKPFNVCYHINENTFLNRTTVQIQVLDMNNDSHIGENKE